MWTKTWGKLWSVITFSSDNWNNTGTYIIILRNSTNSTTFSVELNVVLFRVITVDKQIFHGNEIWHISVRLSDRSKVTQNKIYLIKNWPQCGLNPRFLDHHSKTKIGCMGYQCYCSHLRTKTTKLCLTILVFFSFGQICVEHFEILIIPFIENRNDWFEFFLKVVFYQFYGFCRICKSLILEILKMKMNDNSKDSIEIK